MDHSTRAQTFLENEQRVNWHDEALWFVRKKRDLAIHQVPEWEQLRELAATIKSNVLSNLDSYLEQFEAQAIKNGVHVHWAADAKAHNRIVLGILKAHNIQSLVKSKSMLTEECQLNSFLEAKGVEVIDTDLGEHIIQLRQEPPSHIVLPAIHLKKEEVGELFHEKLDTPKDESDPAFLTEAARQHLRRKFLTAKAALTGVNFAIAETGGVVVCTNEGNADMGVHLARVQIHSMGLEKILPRQSDLGVFTRLLARSATGQPITIYTSHYHRPKPGGEMHIIIVDNGRSEHLGREDFRDALKCIRCGACLNTCPVYRRSGGHSYGSTLPGPIGSILMPGFDVNQHSDLPFASTLCGSCSDVCPVKINIHEQLYKWRQLITRENQVPVSKKLTMAVLEKVLSRPRAYALAGKVLRFSLAFLPRNILYKPWNKWGKQRELPGLPEKSFKDWYKANNRS